mmetsp:Transcript_109633/g.153515  ORF Transcript_109633/g.153515 Transcript_109633/m.153515 type:complete len:235 (-) Transcript_109633:498-1202(-)
MHMSWVQGILSSQTLGLVIHPFSLSQCCTSQGPHLGRLLPMSFWWHTPVLASHQARAQASLGWQALATFLQPWAVQVSVVQAFSSSQTLCMRVWMHLPARQVSTVHCTPSSQFMLAQGSGHLTSSFSKVQACRAMSQVPFMQGSSDTQSLSAGSWVILPVLGSHLSMVHSHWSSMRSSLPRQRSKGHFTKSRLAEQPRRASQRCTMQGSLRTLEVRAQYMWSTLWMHLPVAASQ